MCLWNIDVLELQRKIQRELQVFILKIKSLNLADELKLFRTTSTIFIPLLEFLSWTSTLEASLESEAQLLELFTRVKYLEHH
jgi:hypothetical protein